MLERKYVVDAGPENILSAALDVAIGNILGEQQQPVTFEQATMQPYDAKKVLIICGSHRKRGVSARYARALVEDLESKGNRVAFWELAGKDISGCLACEACRATHECVIRDKMDELYAAINWSDSIEVVSPVYFSGPPAQFKAVLDRLQPYWEMRIGPNAVPADKIPARRTCALHVIGAGGDPYGFDPLVTIVKSAFGSAGFKLDKVVDRIGWGQPSSEQGKKTFPAT